MYPSYVSGSAVPGGQTTLALSLLDHLALALGPRSPGIPEGRDATVGRRMRAAGMAAAIAAVVLPIVFVVACQALGLRRLGYSRSLLLFLVPVVAFATWLACDRRARRGVDWRALAATVGAWTGIGWLLDLTLAATFFRFPDRDAVCGFSLPGLDLVSGGIVPVPGEEFVFYLLGFLIAVVLYLWLDRNVFVAAKPRSAPSSPGPRRLHRPTLLAGALALGAAWLAKGSVPGYALFLVLAVVIPNAWLIPRASPRVNKRALAAAMAVLVVLAAIWEVTLALPNGWWAYDETQMVGWIETPWSRLPIEAVAVWLLWPWTTVVTYEALRARRERVRRPALAPLSPVRRVHGHGVLAA